MLCWRNIAVLSPFSLRTFIEHLPYYKPNTLNLTAKTRKSFATASSLKSSHFETLNLQQKDQISLYVDALLQWNQVLFFSLSSNYLLHDIAESNFYDFLRLNYVCVAEDEFNCCYGEERSDGTSH